MRHARCGSVIDTLKRMASAPPTRAVANLHLHLEYDSGLDVIAAALAGVPEGLEDSDERRAHVSQDISTAVAHLLDVEAITPEGCPVQVTDVSMEVVVDVEHPDDHEPTDGEAEQGFEEILGMAEQLADTLDGLDLTEDEILLMSGAGTVSDAAGPPPFGNIPAGLTVTQLLAEWGILCGYLAEACVTVVDIAFDDLEGLIVGAARGMEFVPGMTLTSTRLPAAWEENYDIPFFRRFICTLSEVTTRVTHEWEAPSNLAQFLALSVLCDEVESHIEDDQMAHSDAEVRRVSAELVELLRERLTGQQVLTELFTAEEDAFAFDEWFFPFTEHERVTPFASDLVD